MKKTSFKMGNQLETNVFNMEKKSSYKRLNIKFGQMEKERKKFLIRDLSWYQSHKSSHKTINMSTLSLLIYNQQMMNFASPFSSMFNQSLPNKLGQSSYLIQKSQDLLAIQGQNLYGFTNATIKCSSQFIDVFQALLIHAKSQIKNLIMASIRSTCNKLFTIFNIVGTTC